MLPVRYCSSELERLLSGFGQKGRLQLHKTLVLVGVCFLLNLQHASLPKEYPGYEAIVCFLLNL